MNEAYGQTEVEISVVPTFVHLFESAGSVTVYVVGREDGYATTGLV